LDGDDEAALNVSISVVRLGTARGKNEGPRLGTVRRPPRGVAKPQIAARDFYDVWLPELAPSAPVVAWALAAPWTDSRWRQFVRKYRAEMGKPAARHLIETLAALSKTSNFSVGCYCEDASRCHRSVLRALLTEAGATVAPEGT
jgi:uncharacterized protein YeaO (DUF488 family)